MTSLRDSGIALRNPHFDDLHPLSLVARQSSIVAKLTIYLFLSVHYTFVLLRVFVSLWLFQHPPGILAQNGDAHPFGVNPVAQSWTIFHTASHANKSSLRSRTPLAVRPHGSCG